MLKKSYLMLIAVVVFAVVPCLRAEDANTTSGVTVSSVLPESPESGQEADKPQAEAVKTDSRLSKLLSQEPEQEHLYKSMDDLRGVILAVTEPVNRVSVWDFDVVKEEANKYFDDTAASIEDYLALIAEDGPVHKASARIGKASLERADSFYLKAAGMKLEKYQKSYNEIGDIMKKQGEQASEIWLKISEQRGAIATALTLVKESKEYFNDLNRTFGDYPAMNELKEVCGELGKLTAATSEILNIVNDTKAQAEKNTAVESAKQ